ncbi:imm11 family protein [Galbibacter mesophilus]|uniref:imm11 family protein n=1 Tax=Galbibacter mesophilus TaxID=379069 RepID=UPI00191E5B34|nr:DUF1629 domain-containing protein [Galbibacter mesophilus]MCM5663622.1 hypothetical protein [Galbibacter mesophilus]
MGDYDNISFPVTFVQDNGAKLREVLDTGYANLFLISERLKNILNQYKISGWLDFEVELFSKKGEIIPKCYGFSVIGRSGRLNFEKSDLVEKILVPGGIPAIYYKGLFPEMKEWDRSDIFMPKGTRFIIVTEKVKEIFMKKKITNTYFQTISEVEILDLIANDIQKYS